jgi:hypothetical protein
MESTMTTSAKVQAPSMDNTMSIITKVEMRTKVSKTHEYIHQKLDISNNGSKGVLSNIIRNNMFPFMGTLQKVYPHHVYVLVIDAIG